ncbi:PA2817 family protein [Agarilytica rhodophyticola]|uniref:PA2817 family protein n=1 Tax=Agarilytica rhodophyticola TaxID=1737490 RepID=UPI000B342A89|nr:PA2817 family protein [Agarilytica rhodophyticola]
MSDKNLSEKSYQQYHQTLIETLAEHIKRTPPFNGDVLDELQALFLEKLDDILSNHPNQQDVSDSGQWLLNHIVSNYQQLMPAVPRDLFWYFGGDCLHFLEDHEISHFQQLDEAFHEARSHTDQAVNYEQLVKQSKTDIEGSLH